MRGNYRIAFDRIDSFSFSSTVFQGLPGLTYQVTNGTVGQDTSTTQGLRAQNWVAPTPTATPQVLTTPPAYSANSLTISDPHMQTPTVAQWGLSVQRELLKNTVLTVSYIGNHGTHLYGGYDSNQVDFRSNGFLNAFTSAQAGIDTPLMTQIASGDTRNTGAPRRSRLSEGKLCEHDSNRPVQNQRRRRSRKLVGEPSPVSHHG